jgi:hypothetical protein
MNYIERFRLKFADSPRSDAYKTYETPPRESEQSSADIPTKPTKAGSVGFVGSPTQACEEFSKPTPADAPWSDEDIKAALARVRWDDGWNGEVFARELEEARAWNDRVMKRQPRRTS